MKDVVHKAIAVVGVGALLPDAPDAPTFWENIKSGRYSITETPVDRWDPDLYYDEDPAAPDKTYSKIGGWVREFEFDPFGWRLPLPPKVADAMDRTQKWSIVAARAALADYGYPDRVMDPDRTAVILGNAMAGDQHYLTAVRIMFPEYAAELAAAPAFAALPADLQAEITGQLRDGIRRRLPDITEDTMPGELGNIIAGRVANLFDFHGPNYTVDAACASAMAAMTSAIEGLEEYDYDTVITGGIDANMSASSFIKFCKIGALSATGTRPYADGADGFVMGEGASVFVLKRLEDAEQDGDEIYAVIRGFGASSDGKGKGITAPNPVGQQLAVKRAWIHAGLDPATVGLVEGHGTSTRVGDVVEVDSLNHVFGSFGLPAESVPLGSVKSNIGHLKGGAGSAGILKAIYALRDKVIPPSINFERPNPNIGWDDSPFYVPTEATEWKTNGKGVRNAGVSAFGFGGTNFHAVLEEYVPGRIKAERRAHTATKMPVRRDRLDVEPRAPLRGALVVGAPSVAELIERLESVVAEAQSGAAPEPRPPSEADLRAEHRVALDYGDAKELATKAEKVITALRSDEPALWKPLNNQGAFYGSGPAPMVAFLYTGQGSQYVNMMRDVAEVEPIVADVFATADRKMTPLLGGKPLTDFIFVDGEDDDAMAAAEHDLRQTEITQPAVLATDEALTQLLAAYGINPDMVMGHSLGEYGALVASGALPFTDALEAVSARGREMAHLSVEDNGAMCAVFGPLDEIKKIVEAAEGYVVVANYNSKSQAVIGGATKAVEAVGEIMSDAGMHVVPLSVSHAFHTQIVAPASEPLRVALDRLDLGAPAIPVVANLSGEYYPVGPNVVPEMIDILGKQVASPVQFVKGLETLYDAGARMFVEVGPKRALAGMVDDVLGDRPDVMTLFTNHPKSGGVVSFNRALCGLYAAGYGVGVQEPDAAAQPAQSVQPLVPAATEVAAADVGAAPSADAGTITQLGQMFAEFLERGYHVYTGGAPAAAPGAGTAPTEPVVITGAGLGLPGSPRVFDDDNLERILEGEVLVDAIPVRFRREMAEKSITRLVKSEAGASFETIDSVADVIKLAGRPGLFDLAEEYGFPADRIPALDMVTQLAIASGLDALRDAGIPLVMRYKTTTTGSKLPDRWMLPEALRDDTAVVFASAFPGADALIDELDRFYLDRERKRRLEDLETLRARAIAHDDLGMVGELDHHIHELRHRMEQEPYHFDRRFLFRVLSMGHSQFAEYIGARGPNTQINSACASTTQAVALAEDWIQAGRARRVLIISADDVTSDTMMGWVGSGFLATGAAATDEVVEDAVIPFDRRRHGLVLGMGAAALVVESAEAARERGLTPICEVLSTVTANSAFHGTRLDVDHIRHVMNQVVTQAEQRWGIDRKAIAPQTVFVSHETYTPARGGSAQAEVDALRFTFEDAADQIVIANTKGYTGHAMGTGIEDVVAVRALETGIVPPVPNLKEPDPDLGHLYLSPGGTHGVEYALRLGAGFGSQVSLSLVRRVAPPGGRRPEIDEVGYRYRLFDPARFESWIAAVSGVDAPQLEVAQRTLRIVDNGVAVKAPQAAAAPVTPVEAPEPVEAVAPAATPVAEAVPVESQVVAAAPEPEVVAAVEAPAEVVASVGGGLSSVEAAVLEVVAEQTGYPPEMLEMDLDLEADLGIDTVKQAETFAAIRERYGIERDESLALRDFPTLTHVVGFVLDRRPDLVVEAVPVESQVVAAEPELEVVAAVEAPAEVVASVDESVVRRVPQATVRGGLDLFAPTGVELEDGSRVVVMADDGGVGKSLVGRLERLGVDVLVIDDAPAADDLERRLTEWMAAGPVKGVYWLPALDGVGDIADLDHDAWVEALRVRVKLLYTAMRTLFDSIGSPETFLVSATRLGGRHGYDDGGATHPLGGAVTGFTKAYKRERPESMVKAVDFADSRKTAALADLLIAETLADPGVVEVGYADDRRWTVSLVEQSAEDGQPGMQLDADTVFLVTGAAGSITSSIVADLSRAAGGGTFHLLDLAPEPDPEDPDLAAFAADRDGLKKTIFARLKDSGERATPAMVEKEIAALERLDAALAAIRAIEDAGGSAHYYGVNLLDHGAVSDVVGRIKETSDRVDVLLHAGGLEISHFLPDKPPEQFDLVFDVKANGWFSLVSGLGDTPLGATVAFSSIAGRFGNGGQTDYSAANDLLCKLTSAMRPTATRAIAIDWTAWADIGMATRGSIPKMMELAGIDMLPAAAGIPFIRRELTAGGRRGEVLVGGALGVLAAEFADSGGLTAGAIDTQGAGPMVGEATAWSPHRGLVVETTLEPVNQPFLDDHRIDGTPVLPGVMGMEAFAEVAALPFPEMHVQALEDVDFQAPFKFYRDEPRAVTVEAQYFADGDDIVARCRLVGSRTLPNQEEPQVTVHFTGSVRLSPEPLQAASADVPAEIQIAASADDVYAIYFHGPAYQVLDSAWRSDGGVVGAMQSKLPPNDASDADLRVRPRLIELCFQTAGIWEMGTEGRMGLPMHVTRAIVHEGKPQGKVAAVVTPTDDDGYHARVVDDTGQVLIELSGYRTVQLPGALDDDLVAPLRDAMAI